MYKKQIPIIFVLLMLISLALTPLFLAKTRAQQPEQPYIGLQRNLQHTTINGLSSLATKRADVYHGYQNLLYTFYQGILDRDATALAGIPNIMSGIWDAEVRSIFGEPIDLALFAVEQIADELGELYISEASSYFAEAIASQIAGIMTGVLLEYAFGIKKLYDTTTLLFEKFTEYIDWFYTLGGVADCMGVAAEQVCAGCGNFWQADAERSRLWELKQLIETEKTIYQNLLTAEGPYAHTLEQNLLQNWGEQKEILDLISSKASGLHLSSSDCGDATTNGEQIKDTINKMIHALGEYALVDDGRTTEQIKLLGRPNLKIEHADVIIDPVSPFIGQDVTLTTNVRNVGLGEARNVILQVRSRIMCANSPCIEAETVIPSIESAHSQQVSVTLNTALASGSEYALEISARAAEPLIANNPQTYYTDLENDNLVVKHLPMTNIAPTSIVLWNPTRVTANEVRLSWYKNNDADFSKYKIYQVNSQTGTRSLISEFNSSNKTACTVGAHSDCALSLTPDTIYQFQASVKNARGGEAYSNIVNAVTGIQLNAPPASAIDSTSLTLSYASNEPTVDYYQVAYATDAAFTQNVRYLNTTTSTSNWVSGLTQGTPYYFKVKTAHKFPTGDAMVNDSNVISVTTGGNPIPIVEMGPEQTVDINQWVDFNATVWDDDPIVRYEWDFNEDGAFDETSTSPSIRHKYTDVSDPGGYEVKMRATDSEGATGADTVNVIIGRLRNLYVEDGDVTASPTPIQQNQEASVKAVVHNNGQQASGVFYIGFYDVNNQMLGNQRMNSIPAGQTAEVSINHTFTATGDYLIKVTVDDLNNVPEFNEEDNAAFKTLRVGNAPSPDLQIANPATDIWIEPSNASAGIPLTVKARISNSGATEASRFKTRFISDPDMPQNLYSVDIWGPETLTAGSSTIIEAFFADGLPRGEHTISIAIDPATQINESNENNNYAIRTFMISEPKPDLEILPGDIWFSPATPVLGDNLTVYARMRNVGSAQASNPNAPYNFINLFWTGTDVSNGIPLAQKYINTPLQASGAETSSISGSTNIIPAGTYNICYSLDVGNVISEINELNNTACQTVTIYADASQIPQETLNPVSNPQNIKVNKMPAKFIKKTNKEKASDNKIFNKFKKTEKRKTEPLSRPRF